MKGEPMSDERFYSCLNRFAYLLEKEDKSVFSEEEKRKAKDKHWDKFRIALREL